MPNTTEPFVNVQAVAELLDKKKDWIYDNQARLGIPRYKVGRHFRYRLSEVARWAEGGRVASW